MCRNVSVPAQALARSGSIVLNTRSSSSSAALEAERHSLDSLTSKHQVWPKTVFRACHPLAPGVEMRTACCACHPPAPGVGVRTACCVCHPPAPGVGVRTACCACHPPTPGVGEDLSLLFVLGLLSQPQAPGACGKTAVSAVLGPKHLLLGVRCAFCLWQGTPLSPCTMSVGMGDGGSHLLSASV